MTWAMSAQTAMDCASLDDEQRPDPLPASAYTTNSIRSGRGDECQWNAILAQITHNIRTPLNAVIGFADLMQRETYGSLGDDRYRQYAEHIRASGTRLLEVAEETLAMTALATRGHRCDYESLDLAAETAAAVQALATHARLDHGAPSVDVEDGIFVRADGPALRHALRNIIVAACQGLPARDKVTIRSICSDGHVLLIIAAPGNRITHGVDGEGLETARTLLRLQGIPTYERMASKGGWELCLDLGSPEPPGLFARRPAD